jgi:RNase P/RNase MRP subunit POP5
LLRRIKRRYLALEIDYDEAFGSKELMDTIWNAISRLFGEYGASKAGLTLIDYDVKRRLLVVRVAHTALGMVYAALASIAKIQDKPVAVHVITVSGTIKTLYKRIKP